MVRQLTIELPEDALRQAEQLAARNRQELSQWVAELVRSAVEIDALDPARDYGTARQAALKLLDRGFDLGGVPIPRDELHER
jgi:hypothetical protein